MSHYRKEMLSFFVTTKCNLICSYCYTNKESYKDQSISLDFAKCGINTFLPKLKKKHIRFYGPGEPTTELQLISNIYKYASKKYNSELSAEIQTNGVFGEKVRDWLAENIDIIWISCDGLPHVQNKYRRTVNNKPTSDFLETNIRYLVNKGKNHTGIRVTITIDNNKEQIDMLKYFHSLGVKHVWSDPVFPAIGEVDFKYSLDLMEYAENFVSAYQFAKETGMFYGSILTCNFDEKTKYHCRACIPAPHLTTDGYVSACDMALFGENKDHMSLFIFGKWNREINQIELDNSKIQHLQNRHVDNMPECKNCEVKYNCGGYCLGEVQNEIRNLYLRKERVCEPIKYLSKQIDLNTGCYPLLHP